MPDHRHSEPVTEPDSAPGWNAIDETFANLYPGQTPHQFASQTAYDLDSPNPLPAITVWEASSPHGSLSWHFVSYGLSELFEKSSDDLEYSGFGFELTFRLPRKVEESSPPPGPLNLLQSLGRHVLEQRQGFDTGHCLALDSSNSSDKKKSFVALVCIPDPAVSGIHTPFGKLLFLQLVSVYRPELEWLQTLDPMDRARFLIDINPNGLNDPTRISWLEDPNKKPTLDRFRLGLKF